MSHYLVELYTPNSAWRALPADSRQQFLDGIQTAMGGLSSLGVEVLALGEKMDSTQLIAFGLALAGVVLATLPSRVALRVRPPKG